MVLKSKLHKSILFLLIIISVGIFGYMFLSGLNFVNAIYMTVITITTVDFSEVQPLND